MAEPNRTAQTERHYRNSMHRALSDLVLIMNPQDKINWQGLKYEELVAYARDWLQTEVVEVTATKEETKTIPAQAGLGLSLD